MIDILAIAAHRDDAEQTCGGALLKMARRGLRTGILDLTRGEMGTRGTAAERAREAANAARILQVSWRGALDLPDGRVENSWENRLKLARVIRVTRPRVVILPYWQGRHPDHYTTSLLGYEACFLAGLAKLETPPVQLESSDVSSPSELSDESTPCEASNQPLAPHRPFKIIYATLYYDIRPTFVIDITNEFEARLQSLLAYESQYSDQQVGGEIFPRRAEIRARLQTMAKFYGLLAGVEYAEPFLQKEVGLVEDVSAIPVASF